MPNKTKRNITTEFTTASFFYYCCCPNTVAFCNDSLTWTNHISNCIHYITCELCNDLLNNMLLVVDVSKVNIEAIQDSFFFNHAQEHHLFLSIEKLLVNKFLSNFMFLRAGSLLFLVNNLYLFL